MLSHFRLPGEAQKIDRIMSAFAGHFTRHNPNVFSSADTAYILAFSLIMLNTDHHNRAVKRKMTLQDFVKNNRSIDNGKDLPPELLRTLYYEVVSNEIKMKEDDAAAKANLKLSLILGKYEVSFDDE